MKNKIEILEIAKNHSWKYVSEFEELTEDIIEEYQNEVCWEAISVNKYYQKIL